ncbi:c-type cytochrome [Flavobacterium sp.]|uniref:c-type cytochrome n=1 Tax=Flavobacterium sp. TaxID=239 RepID=UPI0038FCA07C
MRKIILFFLTLLVFSCAKPLLYTPTENSTTILLVDLKKGRDLYINSCASCHQLYAPSKFTEKEWEANINRMQPKSKITDGEKQLIYQYITSEPKNN